MNVDLLDQDELAVEFLVRNIDGTKENGRKVLSALVAEENAGKRPRPPRPHPYSRTLTSELAEVKRKMFEIGADLHQLVTCPDELLLARCLSRMLHLRFRLDRSRTHPGYSEQVGRIEVELGGLMQRFRTLSHPAGQVAELSVVSEHQPAGTGDTAELAVLGQQASPPVVVQSPPVNTSVGVPSSSRPLAVKSAAESDAGTSGDNLNSAAASSLQEQAPPISVTHQTAATLSNAGPQVQASIRAVEWAVSSDAARPGEQWPVLQPSISLPHPVSAPPPNGRGQLSASIHAVDWAEPIGASGSRVQPPVSQLPGQQVPVAQRSSIPDIFEPRLNHPVQAPASGPYPRVAAPVGLANGWTMLKWPLRFSGGSRDLPVEEFIFRAETLARVGNISEAALAYGLHQLLTDAANSWYWVYIRGQPNATWPEVRAALIFAFRSSASDAAIRRQIHDRLQQQGERFMEYCLAIQELALRLQRRMSEAELLEVLRRNLAPAYQDRLLFRPVANLHELQELCQQIEEMWRSQNEVHQSRRPPLQINEIVSVGVRSDASRMAHWPIQPPSSPWWPSDSAYASQPPPPPEWFSRSDQIPLLSSMQFSSPPQPSAGQSGDVTQDEQLDWVCAMDTVKRGEYTICWNCDDMGHTFMDCPAARQIFCYGCGAKNVVRPQCPKCSAARLQGNAQRNGRPNPFGRGPPFQPPNPQGHPRQPMPMQQPSK